MLAANEGLTSIPSWFLKEQRPVFLRLVLIAIFNKEQGYAEEMCIGGFYIDQFLRNPKFDFGNAMEERFMHEVRKAIIIEHHQQMKPVLKLLILMIKGDSYLLYYCYFSYGHIYWHITQILIFFCQFSPEP